MDPIKMVPGNSPRAICSPEEGHVAADSQNQQPARPRPAKSRRRRCRQKTSEWQREDQPRVFQVYKFRSRAPSISVHCSGRGSLGLSRIPALPDDGSILEMLARSASYWRHQEPARCWVRDCTCSAARPSRMHLLQRHLQGEENHLTSLIREELFSMDEVIDGSTGDSGTASSQADVESDDEDRRRFAEEYSLVPLSRRNVYSAQSFHQQVEEYFRRL